MEHRHLVLAYAATIGIHLIYVTYVAVRYRLSGRGVKQG